MSKLEGVQPADHLIGIKSSFDVREVMFIVKELIAGTDDLVVEELGQYQHRHVVLNWTGSRYRNPASEEEYSLKVNPANAVLRAYAERAAAQTHGGAR